MNPTSSPNSVNSAPSSTVMILFSLSITDARVSLIQRPTRIHNQSTTRERTKKSQSGISGIAAHLRAKSHSHCERTPAYESGQSPGPLGRYKVQAYATPVIKRSRTPLHLTTHASGVLSGAV